MTTTTPSVSSVVRTILQTNIDLPVPEVLRRVKLRGLKPTEEAVKKAVYNIRGELRKAQPKAAPATVPAAARKTAPAPDVSTALPGLDLTVVLAHVALVNKVVGLAGGVDAARAVAEAVRTCGSVDDFLKHLDLVSGIRTSAAS